MRMPDGTGATTRTATFVQPADLPATLLDWFEIDVARQTVFGKSLLSVARDEIDTLRDRACMIGDDGQRAIRTSAWYLRWPSLDGTVPIDTQACELYAKPDDRWDVNEVANRCPDVVDELAVALIQFEQALQSGKPAELSPLSETLVSDLD